MYSIENIFIDHICKKKLFLFLEQHSNWIKREKNVFICCFDDCSIFVSLADFQPLVLLQCNLLRPTTAFKAFFREKKETIKFISFSFIILCDVIWKLMLPLLHRPNLLHRLHRLDMVHRHLFRVVPRDHWLWPAHYRWLAWMLLDLLEIPNSTEPHVAHQSSISQLEF